MTAPWWMQIQERAQAGYAEAEVIPVIRTVLSKRGSGKDEGDPVRRVTQFWSLDGDLLAESDPFTEGP